MLGVLIRRRHRGGREREKGGREEEREEEEKRRERERVRERERRVKCAVLNCGVFHAGGLVHISHGMM